MCVCNVYICKHVCQDPPHLVLGDIPEPEWVEALNDDSHLLLGVRGRGASRPTAAMSQGELTGGAEVAVLNLSQAKKQHTTL